MSFGARRTLEQLEQNMAVNGSAKQEGENQPMRERSKLFQAYDTLLTLFGIFGVLTGLVGLPEAIVSGSSVVRVADAIFNMVFGVLIFICSRVFVKGKALVIWLVSGCVLLSMIYSFVVGRGFNFVTATVGTLFVWQLFALKKQGELS
jgi:hypothetical protein